MKKQITPCVLLLTLLSGCASSYEPMSVRQLSHEMSDSHFGLKNVNFDATITSIQGDSVMLSDGETQIPTVIQKRARTQLDALHTGDRVSVAGYIENTGEHGWVKNIFKIEKISPAK